MFEWLSQIATVAGVVAVLLSVTFSVVARWRERMLRARAPQFIDVALGQSMPEDYPKDSRLTEARGILLRQESTVRWNRLSASALTFTQYIVGGVLASSFVQQSLSKDIVGLLGLLVLISSLVHQRYRPDIQTRAASERVLHLRRLIRETEDALFALSRQQPKAPSLHEIRAAVTDGLTRIEEAELRALDDVMSNQDRDKGRPYKSHALDAQKEARQ